MSTLNEQICKWSTRYTLPGDVTKDVYILPVSGGADSTALAIILHKLFPEIAFQLIFTDTGAETPEIYSTLNQLESLLDKPICRISDGKTLWDLIDQWGGFLPSSQARYCTNHLKRVPFVAWLKQFEGRQKYIFVGLRSDESDRVAFTIDEAQTEMPMIDMGIVREDVFAVLRETIGIPSYYRGRTRSGCSVCPFQRKSELVFLMQEQPVEFKKGAAYEKLVDADKRRQDPAPPLTEETRIALNWLSLPIPRDGDDLAGKHGVRGESIFGDQGIWLGAEFFEDGFPGMEKFIFHQRVVSYSPTLAGIKRQMQDRFMHLLKTSEVYDMSPDEIRRQAKFAIYFVEAPAHILDVAGPGKGSYTWHQGTSYNQIRHVITWGTRILHAERLADEVALGQNARITSWLWEIGNESAKGLASVTAEVGRVVCRGWFVPKEPTEVEELEALDERFISCPMCHI